MSANKYSKEQLDFLKQEYPQLPLKLLTEAFNRKFNLSKSESQIRGCLRNHKIRSGRTGRFESGSTPWNEGLKGRPVHENSKATQFKKGQAPKNAKPVGHERICKKDDYVLIKVNETNPYTGAATRYKHKHIVLWERENGSVPKDHVVIFADGNKRNFAIDNLKLVHRKLLLQLNRNNYSQQSEEVKPAMLNLSKLQVKLFEKSKGECDAN